MERGRIVVSPIGFPGAATATTAVATVENGNSVQVFGYEGKTVRTALLDGEPWFVAADVAEVLGYVDTDQAVRNHCKAAKILKPVESTGMKIPNRGMTVIPERDVYRLIMRSKLPTAQRFEEWVVAEVLPSIRKHGAKKFSHTKGGTV